MSSIPTAEGARPTVLLLESLHPEARRALAEAADVFELEAPDASLEHVPLGEVTGLITRGRGRVDAALLDRLGSLQVIARAGVGLDNVDRRAAHERGVRVLNVPNALTVTVAEHTIALALAARRAIPAIAEAARDGRWAERESYAGESVAGARTAVLGLGAIGTRAAALLRALGADVVTWGRSPSADPGFEPVLERALEGASLVTVHVALTPETRGLLNADRLARLAQGATVVNTARPAIVDRGALLAALDAGRVGAYAVDGFDPEPPPEDDELLIHPGVLVTPHVAALTTETYSNLCRATVRGVLDVLGGAEPSGGARLVPGETT